MPHHDIGKEGNLINEIFSIIVADINELNSTKPKP